MNRKIYYDQGPGYDYISREIIGLDPVKEEKDEEYKFPIETMEYNLLFSIISLAEIGLKKIEENNEEKWIIESDFEFERLENAIKWTADEYNEKRNDVVLQEIKNANSPYGYLAMSVPVLYNTFWWILHDSKVNEHVEITDKFIRESRKLTHEEYLEEIQRKTANYRRKNTVPTSAYVYCGNPRTTDVPMEAATGNFKKEIAKNPLCQGKNILSNFGKRLQKIRNRE